MKINTLKIINGVIAAFIVMPIWFYILYQILDAIKASELTWFLYFIYVPFAMFVGMVSNIISNE